MRGILSAAILATALMCHGQIFDPSSANRIKRIKTSSVDGTSSMSYIPMLISIADESAAEELEKAGTVIFNRREDILLACVPVDMVDLIGDIHGIARASAGRMLSGNMDRAREFTGVDKIHAGTGLPQAYNGSGIITGFSDIGFDPHHVTFGDRVGMITNYDDTKALRTAAYSPEEISSWITDTRDECHATHVAGIMAGGYEGNGYYGVAPEATIAATTSILYDVGILAGVEDIIAYAKESGRPAVINLSLGSYTGPHDGSDLFCRYLDRCGNDAVICLSAGNYGARDNTLSHDFTASAPEIRTMLESSVTWDGMAINGQTDIWSSDERDFKVMICVYDSVEREFMYSSPWIGGEGNPAEWSIRPNDDAGWDMAFDGELYVASELNPLNNRYNTSINYDFSSKGQSPYGPWSRYFTAIIVSGQPGMHADLYSDGVCSYFHHVGVEGYTNGNPDQSISNMSCGHNTITVGQYNTRNSATALGGGEIEWDFETGTITEASAYGTLIDGRHLPHFCAPGNRIISAMSTPYLESHPEAAGTLTGSATIDGMSYYWFPMGGTSMSSPHAAGTIALWLQADPDLDVHEILEIAQKTARKDFADISDPRWGAGALDAYSGLKEIISSAGMDNVPEPLLVSVTDRRLRIDLPGVESFEIGLYNTSGIPVNPHSPLEPGIYILQVKSPTRSFVRKISVR